MTARMQPGVSGGALVDATGGMVAIAVLATIAVAVLWISVRCFLSCCCRGKKAKKPKKA